MAGPFQLNPLARPMPGEPASYQSTPAARPTSPADIFKAELLAGGLPPHAVDGIMMNGHDESGFNPAAVGDNGNAFGILQWNGPRMRALKEFAASQGADPSDPRIQAQFTLHELQGPEKAAYDRLMATTTPGEAGAVFVNYYERPAESHRARREAAYLGGKGSYAMNDSARAWQPGASPNALAGPSVGPFPGAPQNALAQMQQPQMQWTEMRVDPSMFMNRRNSLAMG